MLLSATKTPRSIIHLRTSSALLFACCYSSTNSLTNNMAAALQHVKRVPEAKLGVSEPPPDWFGNPPNAANPAWTNKNWLKSRFHFSFAEYSNPANQNFGVLRVMNDDLVQPSRGFGEHPHRDVEICTYIVEGSLTHKDSMGTSETLTRGGIQFMTAGSGVTHSEHNRSPTEALRFIQIWITTRARGLKPNYGQYLSTLQDRENKWAHLVTDVQETSSPAAIKINQDANIFVCELDEQKSVPFVVKPGRQVYVLQVEGGGEIKEENGAAITLNRHDAAEVRGPVTFVASSSAAAKSHWLLVEMALDERSGRKDL